MLRYAAISGGGAGVCGFSGSWKKPERVRSGGDWVVGSAILDVEGKSTVDVRGLFRHIKLV
jgi:hypothetical protein